MILWVGSSPGVFPEVTWGFSSFIYLSQNLPRTFSGTPPGLALDFSNTLAGCRGADASGLPKTRLGSVKNREDGLKTVFLLVPAGGIIKCKSSQGDLSKPLKEDTYPGRGCTCPMSSMCGTAPSH